MYTRPSRGGKSSTPYFRQVKKQVLLHVAVPFLRYLFASDLIDLVLSYLPLSCIRHPEREMKQEHLIVCYCAQIRCLQCAEEHMWFTAAPLHSRESVKGKNVLSQQVAPNCNICSDWHSEISKKWRGSNKKKELEKEKPWCRLSEMRGSFPRIENRTPLFLDLFECKGRYNTSGSFHFSQLFGHCVRQHCSKRATWANQTGTRGPVYCESHVPPKSKCVPQVKRNCRNFHCHARVSGNQSKYCCIHDRQNPFLVYQIL